MFGNPGYSPIAGQDTALAMALAALESRPATIASIFSPPAKITVITDTTECAPTQGGHASGGTGRRTHRVPAPPHLSCQHVSGIENAAPLTQRCGESLGGPTE